MAKVVANEAPAALDMKTNPSTAGSGGSGALKILTYNVGLLSVKLCGQEVWANPKFGKERLPYIVKALRESDADIVALQECYETKDIQAIWEPLKNMYPHIAWKHHCSCCVLMPGIPDSNGLVMLSKFPIESFELEILRDQGLQKFFVPKCNMLAVIQVTISVHVYVLHLTTAPSAPCFNICYCSAVIRRCPRWVESMW
jgi:endonuclease/exonuclease/phosphatase family metal-dependent hydrolase